MLLLHQFEPGFKFWCMRKRLHVCVANFVISPQQLPLLQIHADVLQACVRHGDAEQDNSIVIEEIRRRVL